jgi:hypothetical protein
MNQELDDIWHLVHVKRHVRGTTIHIKWADYVAWMDMDVHTRQQNCIIELTIRFRVRIVDST